MNHHDLAIYNDLSSKEGASNGEPLRRRVLSGLMIFAVASAWVRRRPKRVVSFTPLAPIHKLVVYAVLLAILFNFIQRFFVPCKPVSQ